MGKGKTELMSKKLYIVSVILLCAVSAILFFYATPFGVGLTNDSSAYIGGARSILAGYGYVRIGGDGLPRAITHFPPFYSIVLAGVSRIFGLDPLAAAKWVNLCCSVLNQALFMTVLLMLTNSCLAAFLGGVTFLCAGPVLQGQIYGLSEALYLTLFLSALVLSLRAARKRKTMLWALVGLLTGALILTRYAGFAAAGAFAVYILCALPSAKERMSALLCCLIGTGIPAGIWMLLQNNSGESAVNRAISLHLPAADKVEEGIRNLAGFFLPEFGGLVDRFIGLWGVVIAAGLIALTGAVIFFGLRSFFHPSGELLRAAWFVPALHGAAYMVMLILTVCFVDGSTLFDNRILLPFYVCMMMLIAVCCSRLFGRKGLQILAVLVMLGFAALLFEDEWDLIREFHRNGQGMAGEEWRESETRLAALEIPAEMHLFSNRQTALYLLNGQPSYILPPMFDSASFTERESFEQDRLWMQSEVLGGQACAVIFNYQDLMENADDREWLETVLAGLPEPALYRDGAIFCKK